MNEFNNDPDFFLARQVITADESRIWYPPELAAEIDGSTLKLSWKCQLFAAVINVKTTDLCRLKRSQNLHIWAVIKEDYEAMEMFAPLPLVR